MSVTRKTRRYIVSAMFDIGALNMEQAKDIADSLLKLTIESYVRVKDRDSGLVYEHNADGKWKKVAR
jgi:hypothetical protein